LKGGTLEREKPQEFRRDYFSGKKELHKTEARK
jgi:hypothetical protein